MKDASPKSGAACPFAREICVLNAAAKNSLAETNQRKLQTFRGNQAGLKSRMVLCVILEKIKKLPVISSRGWKSQAVS
jgi:hypothetical protein